MHPEIRKLQIEMMRLKSFFKVGDKIKFKKYFIDYFGIEENDDFKNEGIIVNLTKYIHSVSAEFDGKIIDVNINMIEKID